MTNNIIRTQQLCFKQMYKLFDATSRFCLDNASGHEARSEMLKLIIAANQLKRQMDTLSDCIEEEEAL